MKDDRPLGSYTALMGVFGALFGGLLVVSRDRLPDRFGVGDLVLGGVATHKISRLLAKDKVTQPLRAPFTENSESAGPSEVSEEPAGQGPRLAIGELVSCPYCLGMWVGSALLYGFALMPRITRFVAAVFTVHAAADFLQIAYSKGQDTLQVAARERWIVDGMNVIGSRPDGWWRDRPGAMRALAEELARWSEGRELTVVFDGRPFELEAEPVNVVFASRRGPNAADDDIVGIVEADPDPRGLRAVTSDHELARRVGELGAEVVSAGSFRALLEA